ncbi:MAG: hypothetical protein NVS1B7_0820 [Candidatus Saccharimonadales bacterium]
MLGIMRTHASANFEISDLHNVTTYQAGVMQATTHRVLQKHCDEILKVYGVTKMQWLIIGTVLDAGSQGIRITELSEAVGTNLPYLTNTINLLESKNILIRTQHKEDNRSKLVAINPTFINTCQEIENTLRQALRRSIYANIDPKEFHIYMKVMSQLANVENPNIRS